MLIYQNQSKNRQWKSDIIENLSNIAISDMEKQEKRLNFCPTTLSPDWDKNRLKEFFYKEPLETAKEEDTDTPDEDDERCELKTKIRNRYYNQSKDTPP